MAPKRNDQQISDKVISVAASGTEILGEASGMAHYQAFNPFLFATLIPQCTTYVPVYLFLMTLMFDSWMEWIENQVIMYIQWVEN